jgi:uncharacterized Zn finger protein
MPSVADLVEDPLRERASEYLVRAGEVLRSDGRVEVQVFEPLRVTASVNDGGAVQHVSLESRQRSLVIICDCPSGVAGTLCPHAVATAIEAWERAPTREC